MKVIFEGPLEVPAVISSLLLGVPVDSAFNPGDFTLTLDQNGVDRLSSILHFLYSDDERVNNFNNQRKSTFNPAPMEKEPVLPQQPISEPVRTVSSPVTNAGKSMKELKALSKKFVG